MCERSDAIAALVDAAECLSRVCMTRIGTVAALEQIYRNVVAEPVPRRLMAVLERLDADKGGKTQ